MAKKLKDIRLISIPADTYMWLRTAIKLYVEEYYEYLLMYVYDISAILMNKTKILKYMEGKIFKYKNGKIAPPEVYLRSKLK